jgi:membrane protein
VTHPAPHPIGLLSLGERAVRLARQARDGTILMGRAAWKGVVEVAYGSDDMTHAAAIAYYALLSFLPFLLLAMSIFGAFPAVRDARGEMLQFVLRYFPAQPDFLATNIDAFWETRLRLGIGGLLGLVWASLGVFGAISTAVNHAWAVDQPRSFWGHRWFSLLMMAASALLLFAALLVLSASKVSGTAWSVILISPVGQPHFLTGWVSKFAAFAIFVVVVGMIFYFVPNTKVRLRDVWPGAVLTALLWRASFEGFSWYVRQFARASVHGSIATVVWFLIWIYITAVILLYGVEFTAAYARLRREPRGTPPPVNAS